MSSPPNYRPAERCCATCDEGHGSGINAGYYCSRHDRMLVSKHYVCDDWRPEVTD